MGCGVGDLEKEKIRSVSTCRPSAAIPVSSSTRNKCMLKKKNYLYWYDNISLPETAQYWTGIIQYGQAYWICGWYAKFWLHKPIWCGSHKFDSNPYTWKGTLGLGLIGSLFGLISRSKTICSTSDKPFHNESVKWSTVYPLYQQIQHQFTIEKTSSPQIITSEYLSPYCSPNKEGNPLRCLKPQIPFKGKITE